MQPDFHHGLLASSAAPASLDALLAHLFASRFAHAFVYRLLGQRFPMTLPRGVDWSPAQARCRGCCLFRPRLRLVLLRGLAYCHSCPPVKFRFSHVTAASNVAPDVTNHRPSRARTPRSTASRSGPRVGGSNPSLLNFRLVKGIPRRRPQKLVKLRGVHRLDEVQVKPRFTSPEARLRLSVPRQRHE